MKKIWMWFAIMMLASANVAQAADDLTISYSPIVKKAAPAVVNIYTKTRVQVQDNLSPFMNDPFFRQFFQQQGMNFGGRAQEKTVSSLGSGVIIKADGLVVTSYHVIKDAQEISVVLSNKREYTAKVAIKDPQSDLAFLKLDTTDKLPTIDIRDSDTLEVGDRVLAIGNPFGVGQTVTSGIISALARPAVGVSDYQFFIQTDAAINPGNSGGALVDMHGQLIGINTAIYSKSGGSNGIGFAIPANMIRALLDSKAQDGKVIRPWFGASVQPVTSEIAESLGLSDPQGVLVKDITPGSAADKATLKPGDVILAVGNSPVDSDQELKYRVALTHIGDTVQFKIMRQGQPLIVIATMQAQAEVKADQRILKGHHPLDGVTVANIAADNGEVGVVVILAESSFGMISLQPGDIIREINASKITSTAQLENLLKTSNQEWKMVIQRGNNSMSYTMRMQ